MTQKKNQIKAGAVMSYLSIGLNILAGLVYTPWMVHQIGQNQYGLYTLANSLITLFLVDFGLSSATARYVSKLHAEGNETGVQNFLGVIYKLYLIIDAVILTVLVTVFFLLDQIYVQLTPQEMQQFKVVYIIAALFSVVNFPFVTLNGILTAYEKFVQLKLADVIYRVGVILLMVVALLSGGGLYALVTVNAVMGLLIIAYKLLMIKRSIPIRVNFRYSDRSSYKDIFGFSLWSTVAALSQRLIFTITPSVLGIVSSAGAIAVFGVVTTIEGYTYMLSNAINGMFMPRVARIYTQDNAEQKLLALMLSVGRFQYGLNGLIVAGFAVLGREFISLWMGPEYLAAYYGILLVIVPGMFFTSLQVAHTAIVLTKQIKSYACVNAIAGICNVVLSFPLSARYGVIGACTSIFTVYVFRAIALNLLYHRKLKIDMGCFVRKCYLYMSIPVILTIAASYFVCGKILWEGWQGLIIKAVLIVLIYGLYLLVFVFKGKTENIRQLWKH